MNTKQPPSDLMKMIAHIAYDGVLGQEKVDEMLHPVEEIPCQEVEPKALPAPSKEDELMEKFKESIRQAYGHKQHV